MRKKTSLIFDLDGVLVNTIDAHFSGWSAVARILGVPLTKEDNEKFRGISRRNVIMQLSEQTTTALTEDDINRLMELKANIYREYVKRNQSQIQVKGAPLLLKSLKEYGYKMGLASASKNAYFLLRIAEIESYFDVISDGHFNGKIKPDPEQLLSIASRLKTTPQNCIVVEDSIVGLQAAQKAGMHTMAIGKYASRFGTYDIYYDSLNSVNPKSFIENINNLI